MFSIVIIFLLGIAPSVLSLWLLHRAQLYYRQQYNYAHHQLAIAAAPTLKALPAADMICIDGYGYVIGKVSCIYNARSPYIRCAVNPNGPCEDCRYYECVNIDT